MSDAFRRFLLLSFWILPTMASADLGDGCKISIIQPQSAADKAGAHLGDVLVEADGHSISTMSDLHIAVTPVEGNFVMMVERDDALLKLKADVHSTPGQPKLGIKCLPVKDDASASTLSPAVPIPDPDELPKLVPTPLVAAIPASVPPVIPAADASPVPSLEVASNPLDAATQDSIPQEAQAQPLNCPFPLPARAMTQLTLKDGKTVKGKLLSCDPQKVTIRSGLLSGTFNADRVVKIEILP